MNARFVIGEKRYFVFWEHVRFMSADGKRDTPVKSLVWSERQARSVQTMIIGETVCVIREDGFEEHAASGRTYCSASDHYNRREGRLASFERAVSKLWPGAENKARRGEAWRQVLA